MAIGGTYGNDLPQLVQSMRLLAHEGWLPCEGEARYSVNQDGVTPGGDPGSIFEKMSTRMALHLERANRNEN